MPKIEILYKAKRLKAKNIWGFCLKSTRISVYGE